MSRQYPSPVFHPVTEFRASASAFLKQVQTTKRPIILTQHGRSAAVLLDVTIYQDLMEELALLRDVLAAEDQMEKGEGALHAIAARRLRERLLE